MNSSITPVMSHISHLNNCPDLSPWRCGPSLVQRAASLPLPQPPRTDINHAFSIYMTLSKWIGIICILDWTDQSLLRGSKCAVENSDTSLFLADLRRFFKRAFKLFINIYKLKRQWSLKQSHKKKLLIVNEALCCVEYNAVQYLNEVLFDKGLNVSVLRVQLVSQNGNYSLSTFDCSAHWGWIMVCLPCLDLIGLSYDASWDLSCSSDSLVCLSGGLQSRVNSAVADIYHERASRLPLHFLLINFPLFRLYSVSSCLSFNVEWTVRMNWCPGWCVLLCSLLIVLAYRRLL